MGDLRARPGVDVDAGQVQGLAEKMVAANLIARPAHGRCTVVDPFLREVWRSRNALLVGAPEPNSRGSGQGGDEPTSSAS